MLLFGPTFVIRKGDVVLPLQRVEGDTFHIGIAPGAAGRSLKGSSQGGRGERTCLWGGATPISLMAQLSQMSEFKVCNHLVDYF